MVLSRAALGFGLGLALLGAGCQFLAGITGDLVLGSGGAGGAGASSSAGTGGGGMCKAGEAVSCFDGPGAPGVGICEAGTKTCNQDGMGYGPCMSQVPPKTETCADTTDEDCDGRECALWSTLFGDAAAQTVTALATDASGNIYVAGTFDGMITMGSEVLTAAGTDVYLAKLTSTGAVLWAKSFSATNTTTIYRILVNDAGEVYVGGQTQGFLEFGTDTLTGTNGLNAAFLGKVSDLGVVLWGLVAGEAEYTDLTGASLDTDGNVIIGGLTACITCSTNAIWLNKRDPSGSLIWFKQFDAFFSPNLSLAGLTVTPFGNVLAAGTFKGTMTFEPGKVLTSVSNSNDLFFVQILSNGSLGSPKRYGDDQDQTALDLAIDPDGVARLIGQFKGSIDFGIGGMTSMGANDIFVVKLGASGTVGWQRSFGNVQDQVADRLAVDKAGNVYFTARTQGLVDYGGGAIAAGGGYDLAVVKLDKDGNHMWSRAYGDMNDQAAGFIGSTPDLGVVLATTVATTIDVGAGPLTPQGSTDLLIARFAP